MNKSKQNLQSIFSDWSEQSPETLEELYTKDYSSLNPKEKALRQLLVDAVQNHEREPIYNANIALNMLQKGHLPCRENYWVAISLLENKDRYYIRKEKMGLRLVHYTSKNLPTPELLSKNAPLAHNGSYLFIRGGNPEVLKNEDEFKSWKNLTDKFVISDMIFYEKNENNSSFYSLGAGCGIKGNQFINFENSLPLNKWRFVNE